MPVPQRREGGEAVVLRVLRRLEGRTDWRDVPLLHMRREGSVLEVRRGVLRQIGQMGKILSIEELRKIRWGLRDNHRPDRASEAEGVDLQNVSVQEPWRQKA